MSHPLIRPIRLMLLAALVLALLPGSPMAADAAPIASASRRCEGVVYQAPDGLAPDGLSFSPSANMSQGFEGLWPGLGWTVTDGYTPHQYLPEARDCEPYEGTYSLWMHGGGIQGSLLGCQDDYPTDIQTWAIYGPFDLSTMASAQLTLMFSGTTEIQYSGVCGDYDYFYYGASADGLNYTGTCLSGEWVDGPYGGWYQGSLDLASYLGESQVWIALEFRSDWLTTAGGIFVDNVTLTSVPASVTETPTPTETNTPMVIFTLSPTETPTPDVPTVTPDATLTRTPSATPTATGAAVPTLTRTASATPEPSATSTKTLTLTPYPSPATDTPTPMPSVTGQSTPGPYPSPPTETPTSTPTPTHTPMPAGVLYLPLHMKGSNVEPPRDLIVNGGFENDDAWVLPPTAFTAAYAYGDRHAGARSMLCGIVNPAANTFSYSAAYQQVTIPADVVYAQLSFWTFAHTQDPWPLSLTRARGDVSLDALRLRVAESPGDAQYALVISSGLANETLLMQCADDVGWVYHSYDLSGYAGRTVSLHYEVFNDGTDGVTSMHIDDVALWVK